jgi:hypothetical protein
VIDLLESLRGIALGTRVDNLNRLFDFLHPLLAECVKILESSLDILSWPPQSILVSDWLISKNLLLCNCLAK